MKLNSTSPSRALTILPFLCALLITSPYQAESADFVSLFDGATLNGWQGDPRYWSVKDGSIVGSTKPNGRQGNTFLIAEGEFNDFILKAKFKL